MAVTRPIKSAGGHSYVEEKALGDPGIQAAEVDADFDTIYAAVNGIPPGPPGPQGPPGGPGATGATGPGVAPGGTTGQLLTKTSATDYATGWTTPTIAASS